MRIRKMTFEKFGKELKGKRIICFGASKMPTEMCMLFKEYNLEQDIALFLDNNQERWQTQFQLCGKEIPIISLREYLTNNRKENDVIVITSRYYPEIIEQLEREKDLKDTVCYLYPMLFFEDGKEEIISGTQQLIPKIIHYCWFGKGEFSEKEKRCIESWKLKCPDYEIIRWDESNTDVLSNQYINQAYKCKKWAFVSDYVRLDVVYRHGGIYLDTDVELVDNLDDMLNQQGFVGFEMSGMINTGSALGAMKNLDIIRVLRDDYDKYSFLNEDGTMNEDACTVYQTRVLKKYGLRTENRVQSIEGLNVYPIEFFCPFDLRTGRIRTHSKTKSIHHFEGTWWSPDNRKQHEWRKEYSERMKREKSDA